MLLFTIFYAQAVLAVTFTSTASGLRNSYDNWMHFEPGQNTVITGWHSHHSNNHEDRQYLFYSAPTGPHGMTCAPGSWTHYMNGMDGLLDFSCPHNQAMNSVFSYHDNRHEDRMFKFRCCDIQSGGKFSIHSVMSTGRLNDYDNDLNFTCNDNSVLVGMYSHHHNQHEDRQWYAKCGVVQATQASSQIYVSGAPVQTGWLNNWHNPFDYSAPAGYVIVGLYSIHANAYESRAWKVHIAPTGGIHCASGAWTHYQNQWDGTFNFQCPLNQVMTGFSSFFNGYHKDRLFRFRCCQLQGYRITQKKNIGYVNEYDWAMDFKCARNEALVGLLSWHHNGHEDRMFAAICGTITKNPPDYDNCSEVTVVDIQVGTIKRGTRKTKDVAQYNVPFNACGNPNTPHMTDLTIHRTQQVDKTESLELSESIGSRFEFATSTTFKFKWTKSATAEANLAVKKGSASTSFEFGLEAGFTTTTGSDTTNTETTKTETGKTTVNVMSVKSTFSPMPYQWLEARASYIEQDIEVDVNMRMQCKRQDGALKYEWLESTVKAAEYGQIAVSFHDRTSECPQAYYKSCTCVDQLKSDFITRSGCQTHPFMSAHPGCYVYKGNDCGNGHGLGVAKPTAKVNVCTDAITCPNAKLYIDHPLNANLWEWSYMPCGGDRYYPGDPGYTGPPINDFVTLESNKHCYPGYVSGSGSYASRNSAILACNQMNLQAGGTCAGVYDPDCDNTGRYYLCSPTPFKFATTSCIWKMQNQHPTPPTPISCWSERLVGKFIWQQHGQTNECYEFQTAKTLCEKASDCYGIATQSNVCGGKYRVTHSTIGRATLYTWSTWQQYNLWAYTLDRSCLPTTSAGRRLAVSTLPKAPEPLPPVEMTDEELFEEFGSDMFDEEIRVEEAGEAPGSPEGEESGEAPKLE